MDYNCEWHVEAEKLRFDNHLSWREVARGVAHLMPDMDEDTRMEKVRRVLRRSPRYGKTEQEDFQRGSVEYKQDGQIVSEKFITVRDGIDMTPEFILLAHGLDVNKWEVVSYKNNFWNSQVKGGDKQISYQSKLTAKPKTDTITFSDFDRYFQSKTFSNDKPITTATQYDPNGETLEIDLPDLHAGLLAWRMETGGDYDLTIARDRFFSCINDAIDRCKGRKFKKILFVTLGDLLHFDNDKQETTKGTFQQADGRTAKIFDCVLDMLIDGVTMLANIAPVEVIYLSGNHDRVMGYALMKAVEKAFVKDDNVQFDTTPDPQKYRLVGVTLVGFTHGDMPTKNMPSWLQHRARKEYGESKFAEIHAGHFHSVKTIEAKRDFNQTDEIGGIVIRYLPTICNASYWEHQQGYVSGMQSVMSFVWSDTVGLREMWYSNL